jgi:hypothetical protein
MRNRPNTGCTNFNVNFWHQITELATVLACVPSPHILTRNGPTYHISIIHTSPLNSQTLYFQLYDCCHVSKIVTLSGKEIHIRF